MEEKSIFREKHKNHLLRALHYLKKALFSRLVITILVIFLQAFFLAESFLELRDYWPGISILLNLLVAALVIYVINRDINPAFKLTWIIPICAVPMLGALLYFWVEANLPTKGVRREVNSREAEIRPYLHQDPAVREKLNTVTCSMSSISRYMEHIGNYPTYQHTETKYFSSGEELWPDMMAELEKAEHYIFLEYFIISEGKVWDAVLELLKRKMAQGVEVKLLYDGVCALYYLPYGYLKKLHVQGVDARVFLPVLPIISTHQNSRDHRKILVIDGKVAYTGGVNLADEYMNLKRVHGYWKDNAVRLRGEAVKTFLLMFLQMWNVSNPANSKGYIPGEYLRYLQLIPPQELQEDASPEPAGFVMPYGDGPNNGEELAENVYLDMMNRSNRYIHITSPYFIVDNEVLTALKYAAKRGNDVRLIIPHIPDKKMTFDVARTFYPELLSAGVRIYEYTPGFIHAKTLVSDDNKAVVGSVNFDFRSFYHHYECGVYFYMDPVVACVEEDFQKALAQSQEVTMEYYRAIPWYSRLCGHVLKLFAPLL